MEKIIALALFATMALYGHAIFPFAEVNKAWNISIVGGYVGYSDPIKYGAAGLSATIKGFYIDFMAFSNAHGNDVRVGKWNDKTSLLCHAGYQIPVVKSFRIIPIIGYAYVTSGVTDGWDWSIGNNGINNKYHSDQSISRFDYGGVMAFNYRRVLFSVGATRSILFGGVGIEF